MVMWKRRAMETLLLGFGDKSVHLAVLRAAKHNSDVQRLKIRSMRTNQASCNANVLSEIEFLSNTA